MGQRRRQGHERGRRQKNEHATHPRHCSQNLSQDQRRRRVVHGLQSDIFTPRLDDLPGAGSAPTRGASFHQNGRAAAQRRRLDAHHCQHCEGEQDVAREDTRRRAGQRVAHGAAVLLRHPGGQQHSGGSARGPAVRAQAEIHQGALERQGWARARQPHGQARRLFSAFRHHTRSQFVHSGARRAPEDREKHHEAGGGERHEPPLFNQTGAQRAGGVSRREDSGAQGRREHFAALRRSREHCALQRRHRASSHDGRRRRAVQPPAHAAPHEHDVPHRAHHAPG